MFTFPTSYGADRSYRGSLRAYRSSGALLWSLAIRNQTDELTINDIVFFLSLYHHSNLIVNYGSK